MIFGQIEKSKKLILIQGFRASDPFKTLPYSLLIIWNLVKPGEVYENGEQIVPKVWGGGDINNNNNNKQVRVARGGV